IVNTGTFSQHYGDSDYDPTNLYASTKQAFESILFYYIRVKGFSGITLVLFDTYGPRDPRPKVFNQLRKTQRTGEPLAMSPGEQLLDLVYIEDVTDAYVLCAGRLMAGKVKDHERYAASSGERHPLKEVVEIYCRVTGTSAPVEWGGRPYRSREVMEPWTLGDPVPGWIPKVPLSEGIRLMEESELVRDDGSRQKRKDRDG
ncbi:MAG: NAD(P)-dependent oxidoreductase, partial [bacterium]|nr:NAD(P)-dependent oxidoreductase [bacterium]